MLLIVALVAAAWVGIQLIPIFLVIIAALIFAGTLDPAVAWLERHGLRRFLSLLVVFGGAALSVVGLGLLIIPPLLDQLVAFGADAPRLQADLVGWLRQSKLLVPAAEAVRGFDPKKLLLGTDGAARLMSMSGGFVEFLGYLGSSLVLSLYLIADREQARGGLYALVPRNHHVRLARILANLEAIVGGYMRGQLITSAAIFAFTFVLLTICGTPGALALAGFAALTDVIPFVGGLLATTPAVLATLSVDSWRGVGVLIAMVAYQEFESRVLVPRIYGRTLRLPSATVVLALLIGGKLLGILGALLALPIAAGLRMIVEELRVELPGDDSEDIVAVAIEDKAQREYERKTAGETPEQASAVAAEIAEKARLRLARKV